MKSVTSSLLSVVAVEHFPKLFWFGGNANVKSIAREDQEKFPL